MRYGDANVVTQRVKIYMSNSSLLANATDCSPPIVT